MVIIKTNKDTTLYDIVFADEIRAEIQKTSRQFDRQIQQIMKVVEPYNKNIWDGIKLKNTPFKDWSTAEAVEKIISEITKEDTIKEICDTVYKLLINSPIGGIHR